MTLRLQLRLAGRKQLGKLLPSAPVETGWVVLADPEGNEFCAFTD
jgi:hypothetical protein